MKKIYGYYEESGWPEVTYGYEVVTEKNDYVVVLNLQDKNDFRRVEKKDILDLTKESDIIKFVEKSFNIKNWATIFVVALVKDLTKEEQEKFHTLRNKYRKEVEIKWYEEKIENEKNIIKRSKEQVVSSMYSIKRFEKEIENLKKK